MRIRQFLALFAAVLLFAAASAQAPKPVVIKNVHIEVGDGRQIATADVLLVNGLIQEVGQLANPPADAEAIDGTGLTLYPGFFDAYSTRGLKLPDWGSILPRDTRTVAPPNMDASNKKGFRPDLKASDCLDYAGSVETWWSSGVTQALLVPGSGTFRGQGTIVQFSKQEKDILVPTFGQAIAFATSGGQGYPGSLMGMMSVIRQGLADAQRYRQSEPRDPMNPSAPLLDMVDGNTPAIFLADSAREIQRALNICSEFGVRCVLASARDAYLNIQAITSTKSPLLVAAYVGTEPTKTPVAGGADSTPQPILDERWDKWKTRAMNTIALANAGIPFALSSEGDQSGFLNNVRKLIKFGLNRVAALQALTTVPAKMFGLQDKLGTIEAGKFANLVLMSGDFADEKSTVRAVFVAGNKFEVEKSGGSR